MMSKTLDNTKMTEGLLSTGRKDLRNAHSLPRMGATSYGGRRGSQTRQL